MQIRPAVAKTHTIDICTPTMEGGKHKVVIPIGQGGKAAEVVNTCFDGTNQRSCNTIEKVKNVYLTTVLFSNIKP